jgi:hypothetical protein
MVRARVDFSFCGLFRVVGALPDARKKRKTEKIEKILKKNTFFCRFYLTKVLKFTIIVIVINFKMKTLRLAERD